ncbi:MAG: DegT/DnrJ/EryC1/StrS family aminotransferase [Betaproteobacteria bacterium]|nr:DegT/DnrJ/EryC1/StrS family aminotransferase [Betaproteobacteria bacterium]
MPDFRSDTVTRPSAAMREAIATADLGDDVFGDDPSVNRLETHAAALLGFEAAVFAPSGTQTNLMGLLAHCERGEEAIVGQQWHTYRWEAGGMAVLGSIQPQPVENAPDGSLPLEAIEAAIKPDDPHFARTRLICMENTTGGKVLPMDYLKSVRALASARGLATHLDGARLFNAAVELGRRRAAGERTGDVLGGTSADPRAVAREICSHFDSVSMCLSKGLGAPIGSLLLGSAPFIARARRWRKMLGGGMRQAGLLAAAAQHALEHHIDRMALDHDRARRLAAGITQAAASHPGALRVTEPPQTNIFFARVDQSVAASLAAHLSAHGIQVTGRATGDGAAFMQRWVTHLDVNDADIDRAIHAIQTFFANRTR